MSRRNTVKPESYPDAVGVDPAGTAGKRQGLPWEASGPARLIRTTASAMAFDGHGAVRRRHSVCWTALRSGGLESYWRSGEDARSQGGGNVSLAGVSRYAISVTGTKLEAGCKSQGHDGVSDYAGAS